MRKLILVMIITILLIENTSIAQNQAHTQAEVKILPTSNYYEFKIWVDLSIAPEISDIARIRDTDNIKARVIESDSNNLRTKVLVELNPRTVMPGMILIDVLGGKPKKIKGSRSVDFRWTKLSDPKILIWSLGNDNTARQGELHLPESGSQSFAIELSHDSDQFLHTDRIRFFAQRLKVREGDPSGPVPGTPLNRAQFNFTVDGDDPPNIGPIGLEIYNPARQARTFTEIRVISNAIPILSAIDQKELTIGKATITVHGANFDHGAKVELTGVREPYSWTTKYESRTTLQTVGMVNSETEKIEVRVRNPNAKYSKNAITIPIRKDVRPLKIQEFEVNDKVIYPEEEVNLILELTTDQKTPAPRPGNEEQYEVEIGDKVKTKPRQILHGGKMKLIFKYPKPEGIHAGATFLTRSIRVLHNNRTRWQSEQGVKIQLRPVITKKATLIDPPLLPGTERQVQILGRHFRSNDLEIVINNNIKVKEGTKDVTYSSIRFTAVATENAGILDSASVVIIQDGYEKNAGQIPITKRPSLDLISIHINGESSPITDAETLEASQNDEVILSFDGGKLEQSMGNQTFTIQAVLEGIGEDIVRASYNKVIKPGEIGKSKVFNVWDRELTPGQAVRVEVGYQDRPIESTTIRIQRTGWAHLGLLTGLAAVRQEIGSGEKKNGDRNATLSDVHFGIEYIIPKYSSDLGVGFGYTVLGVPNNATTNATIGGALTGTFRYQALTLMIGKQVTKFPQPPQTESLSNSEEGSAMSLNDLLVEEEFNKRPFFIMIGLSLGTDLSSLSKFFGATKSKKE